MYWLSWLLVNKILFHSRNLLWVALTFFFLKAYLYFCLCVCESLCEYKLHIYRSLWRAEQGTGSFGAGVTGGSEPKLRSFGRASSAPNP